MNQTQRSKSSRGLVSVIAIVAIVALTGAQSSCRERSSNFTRSGSSDKSETVVVYSVSSNASIETVSYTGSDGKTQSDTRVGRSWSGHGPGKSGTIKVSATTSRDGAWIKCEVTVKGKVVQKSSAQGGAGTRVVCMTTW